MLHQSNVQACGIQCPLLPFLVKAQVNNDSLSSCLILNYLAYKKRDGSHSCGGEHDVQTRCGVHGLHVCGGGGSVLFLSSKMCLQKWREVTHFLKKNSKNVKAFFAKTWKACQTPKSNSSLHWGFKLLALLQRQDGREEKHLCPAKSTSIKLTSIGLNKKGQKIAALSGAEKAVLINLLSSKIIV